MSRHSSRSLLLVTLLFLISQAKVAAQTTTSESEATSRGTISGRILNESGQPIAGVNVYVRQVSSSGSGRTAVTSAEGNFQVNNLDPALYYISATSAAHVMLPRTADTPLPVYRVGDSVRLELVRGGVITGNVTNSANEPVVGARVRAMMVRDANGELTRGNMLSFGERTTDDRGVYRIYGLAAGSYIVQVGGSGTLLANNPVDLSAPTFAPSATRDAAAEIQVRGGEEATADIRFRGEQGRTISGTVRMLGTTGASVFLSRKGDGVGSLSSSSYQTPGARGFMMVGVADGEYEMTAQEVIAAASGSLPNMAISDPLRITVKGADVSGLELVTKPLAAITGRVVLEPSKLPECQNKRKPLFEETMVSLVRNRKSTEPVPLVSSQFMGPGVLDRNGTFSFRNLAADQYAFTPRFFARYWYLDSMSFGATPAATINKAIMASKDAARNWTTVKSGEGVSGLTITLREGAASIRGAIEKSEESKLPAGLSVYLVPAEREKSDDPLRYFIAKVEDDGKFAFNNLPSGRYFTLTQQLPAESPTTTEKLQLPNALETRNKVRRSAEGAKSEVELKPCQNLTGYSIKP